MYEIPLATLGIIIGIVTGMIGMITGVISLVWLIRKDSPKLVLESMYFEWVNKHIENPPKNKEIIKVSITLDNLSLRPTTIKDIWIKVGNQTIMKKNDLSMPKSIPGGNSQSFEFHLSFGKDEFNDCFNDEGEISLGVSIFHTFGSIKSPKIKTNFKTGWFNLV